MRRKWYTLATFLSLALQVFGQELWQEAVEYFQTYGDLTPGRITVTFSQYNGREELVSTEESLYLVSVDESGELDSSLVYARKDGEDVTEERREDPGSGSPFGGGPQGESEGGGAFSGLGKSPFDPAEQPNIEVTATSEFTFVGGSRARRYDFVHETGADSASVGSAWLDAETGMPLRLQIGLAQPPGFIDAFSMVQEYALDDQDRWVGTSLHFTGAGRILFFRRRIESVIQFSEHFRHVES
ncbi:MAG: hypothetical protein ACLFP4_06750 [Spirochaetales bacterium]